MRFTALPVILASLAVAAPAPAGNPEIPESWKQSMEDNLGVVRRETGLTDTDILNFALTLEHLENNFYMLGLKDFSKSDFDSAGYAPATRFNIRETSYDETTHVNTLTSALGDAAVPECSYDFGLTDVTSFLRLAEVLEGVGVTAYLGAAALISDPGYLTVAGSILTVESRHSAYLRSSQLPPMSPFAQPFDVPLSVREVYTLASQFITSCPPSADLGITPFPTLTATSSRLLYRQGDTVTLALESGTTAVAGKTYGAFLYVTGPVYGDVKVIDGGKKVKFTIPKGIAGQSYAVLTNSSSSVDDSNIIAGPAIINVRAPYTYPGIPT